jgi:hypothetical protein
MRRSPSGNCEALATNSSVIQALLFGRSFERTKVWHRTAPRGNEAAFAKIRTRIAVIRIV